MSSTTKSTTGQKNVGSNKIALVAKNPSAPKTASTPKQFQSTEKAWSIAHYYGFEGIEAPTVTKEDLIVAKKSDSYEIASLLFPKTEEKVALVRHYIDTKLHAGPQPVMLYHEGVPHIHGERKKKNKGVYTLEILGTTKSIAEAILIKTAFVILKELGHKNLVVTVNTIGDKESVARYSRELAAYYRKHIQTLSADERELLKKDPMCLLWQASKGNKIKAIHENAPESISFLSDKSRSHFKEILEYLEHLNIQYRIARNLVGNKTFSSETIFTIESMSDDDKETRLAFGSRYASLGKRIDFKKDIPAAGVTIESDAEKTEIKPKAEKKPLFYYIQLGFDAKLKSLELIEHLRQAEIPIEQSLSKDKLGAQLSMAENLKFPFVLIMGQKEAIENSVLVRIMETRSQESVPMAELPAYLKKLSK